MTSELRVVLDTSVLISAVLLARSKPREVFDIARQRGKVLSSEETVAELNEVLCRPKFDKYLAEEKRLEFLAAFVREAELIEVSETITACRDPRDDKFLSLAIAGNASHIDTGDSDLLALHPFRGIAVVSPDDFLKGSATP